MSLTCSHPMVEARIHPGCAGCRDAVDSGAADAAIQREYPMLPDPHPPPSPREWAPQWSMRVSVDLLTPREPTPLERAAEAMDPRPGSWFGDNHADGRMVTQDETDTLIRAELCSVVRFDQVDSLVLMIGTPRLMYMHWASGWSARVSDDKQPTPREVARQQRGGIDSDPLVRAFAVRAWGDRDLRWFEDRGVRAGDQVTIGNHRSIGLLPSRFNYANPIVIHRAYLHELEFGRVDRDALPGEIVQLNGFVCRVSDRLRMSPLEHMERDGDLFLRCQSCGRTIDITDPLKCGCHLAR